LDSTTPGGSLALRVGTAEASVRLGQPTRPWSERLPGDALALLAEHGLDARGVDCFAVNTGPGSLTGLRVGLATIQGLAFATGRPVVAVTAFEAVAEDALLSASGSPTAAWLGDSTCRGGQRLGIWLNAMRGEVFTSVFELDPALPDDPWRELEPASVGDPSLAAVLWRDRHGDNLLIEGDFDDGLAAPLNEAFPSARLRARPPLAAAVASVAHRRARQGRTARPHAVQPLYVRLPDAVLARNRKEQAARGDARVERS
ncbi:MAG: tRNA (adenosine(37)-N6)-threonylcarbamoyltransferase complex dimerization subunit type 1 TsaB, partial [Vicinamibacterales bacterium]